MPATTVEPFLLRADQEAALPGTTLPVTFDRVDPTRLKVRWDDEIVRSLQGQFPLEERTIEQLHDRCRNCGATLTDVEKETALTDGPPGGLVLCAICASEVVPIEESEDADASL